MLSSTSLRAALPNIRAAIFESAALLSGVIPGEFRKSYVMNRAGRNYLRVDVEKPVIGPVVIRVWGPESRRFDFALADAMGTEGYAYAQRLAGALASNAIVKHW